MLEQKTYTNGQAVHELIGKKLTYFFKSGVIKAVGPYENDQMQGEWKFYRESGQLWQVANFKNNKKHGSWVRYDKNDEIEYQESFDNGKMVKK